MSSSKRSGGPQWREAPADVLGKRSFFFAARRFPRRDMDLKADGKAANAGAPRMSGAPGSKQGPTALAPMRAPGTQTLPKPTFDPSSIDLGQSVSQAGLWQMSPARRKSLDKQRGSFLATSQPQSNQIRIPAEQEPKEHWGLSADENTRTAFQRENRADMGTEEAKAVFDQRSHQGYLAWRTGSPSLTQYGEKGDPSTPLGSHTPGLKWQQGSGTAGAITKEHGRRDALRARIVDVTFKDAKRGPYDTALMSRATTLQVFMGPGEELKEARAEVEKSKPIYSVFKDIGNIAGPRNPKFDVFVNRLHTVREIDKMALSRNLFLAGRPVHKEHMELLKEADFDIPKAMDLLHQYSQDSKRKFNDAKHSIAPRLDQQSLRNMTQPPLSPPRRIETPAKDIEHFKL